MELYKVRSQPKLPQAVVHYRSSYPDYNNQYGAQYAVPVTASLHSGDGPLRLEVDAKIRASGLSTPNINAGDLQIGGIIYIGRIITGGI